MSEYKDNEVRADGRYKDKYIEVSGTVGEIKKDITGGTYVTVGTGGEFEIPVLQCSIAPGQESAAAELSRGQKATVRGTVDGLMMNVLAKDCVVEPVMQLCQKLKAATGAVKCHQGDGGIDIQFDEDKPTTTVFSFGVLGCFADGDKLTAEEKYKKMSTSDMTKKATFIGSTGTLCYGWFNTIQGKNKGPGPIDPALAPKIKAFFESL